MRVIGTRTWAAAGQGGRRESVSAAIGWDQEDVRGYVAGGAFQLEIRDDGGDHFDFEAPR